MQMAKLRNKVILQKKSHRSFIFPWLDPVASLKMQAWIWQYQLFYICSIHMNTMQSDRYNSRSIIAMHTKPPDRSGQTRRGWHPTCCAALFRSSLKGLKVVFFFFFLARTIRQRKVLSCFTVPQFLCRKFPSIERSSLRRPAKTVNTHPTQK